MPSKNILLINCHPNANSFCYALAEAYKKGAVASGATVQEIRLRDLQFNLNLEYGYQRRTELEPDLLDAQEKITWANHLVFVYPIWWGTVPAVLKGFLDRTFLPGFAFKYRENSVWWDKLLAGKSARIICTLDQPTWYYRLVNKAPGHRMMKKMVLQFCGVNPVKITAFGPIRNSSEKFRLSALQKVEQLGQQHN